MTFDPTDGASGARERELFVQALERVAPVERAAFLDDACGGDAALRKRLQALLNQWQSLGTFLEKPVVSAPKPTDPSMVVAARDEREGGRIGRYRLLQKIGEGGCGVVYLAEQSEPVKRRVALKVIKLGMDTQNVIARFEAERQALALMDHPNIAKVLDAGATDAGRPYFVMELVRGVKITAYCDEAKLPTHHRLELFIKVCQAIQHAHQKGIIHRDIKPSNILVTVNDGVPVPKVIDFGIAKATNQQQLTDKTVFTALEQIIGTPAYMSPEQAIITTLDIDTRSDIYSLGVLLYEILAGKTPFDQQELLSVGLDEMRRTIREKEPQRPSTKLSTMMAGELTTTAKHRQCEAPKLILLVRGDLDWIVMKALEKDRARRYESANDLAADIQRHLNNEPVIACPPSTAYRLKKLVRRNQLAVLTGAVVAAALACGVVLSLWQAVRARHAERETRQQLYVSDMVVAEKALREGNLRRADELLRAHLPQSGVSEESRGFEYHYLRQQCNGDQEFMLSTNENAMFAVAYSPNGKLIATGSSYLGVRDYSGELQLYDAGSRRLLATLKTQSPDGIRSLAFSPDGKRLAAGGASSVVTIWDVDSHQRIDSFFGRLAEVGTVAFSPAGRLLIATLFGTSPGQSGTILIWDTETRQEIKKFELEISRPDAIALSPDGKWLAYVDQFDAHYGLQLWEIQSRRDGQRVDLTSVGAVHSMRFSPDSKTIALGAASGLVALWSFDHVPMGLGEHAGDVLSVQFSRDGRYLASSSADHTVKIWDLVSPQSPRILRGHRDSVREVAFSPDGTRLVSASLDKTVRVWSTVSNAENVLRTDGKEITAVQFHPDNKLLAIAGANNTLWITDLLGGVRHSMSNLSQTVLSLAFSPDGTRLLAGDSSREISLWETATWRQLDELTIFSPDPGILSLRFSNDGRFAFSGEFGFVSVWETASWRLATNLLSPGGGRLPVTTAVSPDHRLLALASGQVVQLYEIKTWRPCQKLRQPADVGTVAFTADSQCLITGGADAQVRLWDLKNDSEPSAVLGGSVGGIVALAVSPDGNTLAVADASPAIKLWNLTTRKEFFTLAGHRVGVVSLGFSPNGHTLVSLGADATIRVWDGTPENDSMSRGRR